MYLLMLILFVPAIKSINNFCSNNTVLLWNTLDKLDILNILNNVSLSPGLDISQKCFEELQELLENSRNGSAWAVKMIDASGRYSGGALWGEEYFLGSNSLCSNLEHSRSTIALTTSITDKEIYRTSDNRVISKSDPLQKYSIPPYSIRFNVAHLEIKFDTFCQLQNTAENAATLGLCLPHSCSSSNIETILGWSFQNSTVHIKSVRNLQDKYSSLWDDPLFYIISLIIFGMILVIMTGTILEVFMECKESKALWFKAVTSFSVLGNLRSIFGLDVGEDTLAPIHGLKFISMMWVILVHTCLMLSTVASNKKMRDSAETSLIFQFIINGIYSVDTFFTLSGVLVSFLFCRTIGKYSIAKLTKVKGLLGYIVLYMGMTGYRLVRLSPPYLVTIIFAAMLMNKNAKEAPLRIAHMDQINCPKYWWRNALFINTFFPANEMCLGWSWYLANDTQFYMITVLLLMLILRWQTAGLLVTSMLLVASWLTTGVLSYNLDHALDLADPFAHYDQLYDKPWARAGPYLIGIGTGYFLFKIKCTLNMRLPTVILLWMTSLIVMLFLIFGQLYLPSDFITTAVYTPLSHSLWSLAVAWVLIACVTGHGGWPNLILSWKYMYPLSRLSYCAYLVHPIIIREVILSSDTAIYISIEILSVLFLGFLCTSLLFACLLSLGFEAPMVALLRVAHPMRRRN